MWIFSVAFLLRPYSLIALTTPTPLHSSSAKTNHIPNIQASNFLWPFKLSSPTGGFRTRKFRHFVEGGDLGDREQFINQLIRKMN